MTLERAFCPWFLWLFAKCWHNQGVQYVCHGQWFWYAVLLFPFVPGLCSAPRDLQHLLLSPMACSATHFVYDSDCIWFKIRLICSNTSLTYGIVHMLLGSTGVLVMRCLVD